MAQKYIRSEYNGTVVLSNIRKGRASIPVVGLNDTYTATKVTEWYDGTPMTPEKVDGSVYLQLKDTEEYFKVNLPNEGEIYLEKDTMEQMRGLSDVEVLLLKMGYYKGVRLNGYYEKGDTPAPIEYYLSDTIEEDNGGSIIDVQDVKLYHNFNDNINVKYYGAINDNTIGVSDIINKCLTTYNNVLIPKGQYKIDKSISINRNNQTLLGEGNDTVLNLSGNFTAIRSLNRNNIIIDNLFVDCNNHGVENAGAIRSENCNNIVVKNCTVKNTNITTNGISIFTSSDIRGYSSKVLDCIIENTGKSGIYISSDDSEVSGNIVKNSGLGQTSFRVPCIQIRSSKNVICTNNNCYNATQAGIYLFNSLNYENGAYVENVVISNNIINDCFGGINIEHSDEFIQSNLYKFQKIIIDSNIIGRPREDGSVGINVKNSMGCIISNNSINGEFVYGVQFVKTDNSIISNNNFTDIKNQVFRIGGVGVSGGNNNLIIGNKSSIIFYTETTRVGIMLFEASNTYIINNILEVVTGVSGSSVNISSRSGNSFDYRTTIVNGVTQNIHRNKFDTILNPNAESGQSKGYLILNDGIHNTAPVWATGVSISLNTNRLYNGNIYISKSVGVTGVNPPVHTSGIVSDGGVEWKYVNKRAYIASLGIIDYGMPFTITTRPSSPDIGYCYFDTTYGKPIYWDGEVWVDSQGTSV